PCFRKNQVGETIAIEVAATHVHSADIEGDLRGFKTYTARGARVAHEGGVGYIGTGCCDVRFSVAIEVAYTQVVETCARLKIGLGFKCRRTDTVFALEIEVKVARIVACLPGSHVDDAQRGGSCPGRDADFQQLILNQY